MLSANYQQATFVNLRQNRSIILYLFARIRGWLGKVWSALTGHSRHLLDLNTVEDTYVVRGRYYAGMKTVSISQIRGSEDRCDDFDVDFNPLQSHNEERWLNIASAWIHGVSLPAVDLIQVGDIYHVRDGHHRISVARALDKEYIDAKVVVWDTIEPLTAGRLRISAAQEKFPAKGRDVFSPQATV